MSSLQPFQFSKRVPTITPIGSTTNPAPDHVHLSFGFAAGDLFPIDELVQSATQAIGTHGRKALQYGGSDAQANIINWVQERSLVHGIEVEPDNILMVYGGAQGIELTMDALIDPGDQIWVEAPTFFGALNIFRFAQAEIRSFPLDDNGLQVDLLEQALIEARKNNQPIPKLVYTIPMYHNPAGVTLSLERRHKLAELAREYNFFILEDDAYMELNFYGKQLPTLYSLCPERVIYVNTFSKTIGPGVRLGWVIAEKSVKQKIELFLNATPVAPFAQEIIRALLTGFSFENHVATLSDRYRSRSEFTADKIREYFGDHVKFVLPNGGFFIWLEFAEDVDTSAFEADAYRRGVSYVSGKNFYVQRENLNHARVCFSYCDEESIDKGIKRMADAYFHYLGTR